VIGWLKLIKKGITLSASNELHTATIDGHRLVYSVVGRSDLPPLILLHGFGSYRGVWRQTMEALQERYYCVAVDLLGFGDSDKPPDADYSIAAQGRRILQLADTLGLNRFALIGHSMGGQIALCIAALLAPERVTRLVSVSGVVTGRLSRRVERITYVQIAAARFVPQLYTLARWLSRWRPYAYFQFRPWFYRMDALPFETWKIDRDMVNRPCLHLSMIPAWQAIHGLNLEPHLSKIIAPTLAIFGQQDGTVPVSDGHLVQQLVPNSQLVLFDQCGHFPMYEQPQPYLEALRRFMGEG
jgi:abhydrolase domain-containing protein 6